MEHIIETATGKILGYEQNGNKFFFGIPYGDQCDGEFRFLPPRPVSPWKGVYDCTRRGPAAMQNGVELSEMPDAVRGIYVKIGLSGHHRPGTDVGWPESRTACR